MSLTFIDLFAGVGGFRRGMELAGHKCVGFCEWDKYASASYRSMHTITDRQREYLATLDLKKRQKEILKEEYLNGEWYSNDIRGVSASNVPRCNVWCFGAPCQDFSIAGERKGLDGDRSSLVREVFRTIEEFKEEDRPEWIIYENVKGMLSSNNGWDFACILVEMESLGYDIEYQLFNSKDYGVPQNRERVYTIGHLRRYGERKILPIGGNNTEIGINQVMQYNTEKRENTNRYRVYAENGLAPCLGCMEGGGLEPHVPVKVNMKDGVTEIGFTYSHCLMAQDYKGIGNQDMTAVMVREATKKGYAVAEPGDSINLEQPNSKTRRGRVGMGVAQTLTTSCNQATLTTSMRIRKLTPMECFRLQGWTDEYFESAAFVNSDSQLYKQAGNGVTVNVVYEIAKRLEMINHEIQS